MSRVPARSPAGHFDNVFVIGAGSGSLDAQDVAGAAGAGAS